jgi:hypothetical protein
VRRVDIVLSASAADRRLGEQHAPKGPFGSLARLSKQTRSGSLDIRSSHRCVAGQRGWPPRPGRAFLVVTTRPCDRSRLGHDRSTAAGRVWSSADGSPPVRESPRGPAGRARRSTGADGHQLAGTIQFIGPMGRSHWPKRPKTPANCDLSSSSDWFPKRVASAGKSSPTHAVSVLLAMQKVVGSSPISRSSRSLSAPLGGTWRRRSTELGYR